MKIKHNLLKAFTSLSLGLSIISAGQSVAATVIYDFEVRNLTGSLSGNTYSGFFSYDDSLSANQLSGNGIETITSSGGGLSFNFDFLGTTYDETNDPYDRTQVTFNNGVAESIFFRGNYDTYPTTASNTFAFTDTISPAPGIFNMVDFSYLIDSGANAGSGIGDVFITRRPNVTPSLPDLYTEVGFVPKPPITSDEALYPRTTQQLKFARTSEYKSASVFEPGSIVGLGTIAVGLLVKKKKALKA